jgi:hypothetical protein
MEPVSKMWSKIVRCLTMTGIIGTCLLTIGVPARAEPDRLRVATVNSIRGTWLLIAADGQPTELLSLTFGVGPYPISTTDGCNSFWWTSLSISTSGEVTLPIGPVQTLAACRNREPNPIVIKALSQPTTLRRIDSDLLLDTPKGQLRFRLVVPTFPILATAESLVGGWSGSSLNGEPMGWLHVLQFGTQGSSFDGSSFDQSFEPSAGPCAGMSFERFEVEPAGLLQSLSEPTSIPGCVEANNPQLVKLLASRPRVEIDRQSILLVRTPSALAIFSRRPPPQVPDPEQSVPPGRPAIPATDASTTGTWNVESINGIAAPNGLWLSLPALRGSDGCNTFAAAAPKRSGKRQPTFDNDGSMRVRRLETTKKRCSEAGFRWDPRLRTLFRERPIGEHVGDWLVLRSPSTGWESGIWITLRRRES